MEKRHVQQETRFGGERTNGLCKSSGQAGCGSHTVILRMALKRGALPFAYDQMPTLRAHRMCRHTGIGGELRRIWQSGQLFCPPLLIAFSVLRGCDFRGVKILAETAGDGGKLFTGEHGGEVIQDDAVAHGVTSQHVKIHMQTRMPTAEAGEANINHSA